MRKRNPRAANSLATARVSDLTRAAIDELAKIAGLPKSKITRLAIKAGLPTVKVELLANKNAPNR